MSTPAQPRGELAARLVDTLAETLWGEACGEALSGIQAVAAVVLNSVGAGGPGVLWPAGALCWAAAIDRACRDPELFECRRADGPDHAALAARSAGEPMFEVCRRMARRALAGVLADPTRGATRYHRHGELPPWTRSLVPCAEIGSRLFYRSDWRVGGLAA